MSRLALPSSSLSRAPLPIHLPPWVPPWWIADHISSTVARQIGGVRSDLMTNKMVTFPTSVILPAGLTITVGSITWTTGDDHAFKITEQARGSPATTPVTRRPLPCYPRKRIDISDLFQATDRITERLSEALVLTDVARGPPTSPTPGRGDQGSLTRPTRSVSHPPPGTDLTITSGPTGRVARRHSTDVSHQRSRPTGLRPPTPRFRPAPAINMIFTEPPSESLRTVLVESSDSL